MLPCNVLGKVKLKLTPKELKIRLGQNIVLKCQVAGKLMPTIKWLKNKQLLVEDDRTNITIGKYVNFNLMILKTVQHVNQACQH